MQLSLSKVAPSTASRGGARLARARHICTQYRARVALRTRAFKDPGAVETAMREKLASAKLLPESDQPCCCPQDLLDNVTQDFLFHPNGLSLGNMPSTAEAVAEACAEGSPFHGNQVEALAVALNATLGHSFEAVKHTRGDGTQLHGLMHFKHAEDGRITDAWSFEELSALDSAFLEPPFAAAMEAQRAANSPEVEEWMTFSTETPEADFAEQAMNTATAWRSAFHTTDGKLRIKELAALCTDDFKYRHTFGGLAPGNPWLTVKDLEDVWTAIFEAHGRVSPDTVSSMAAGRVPRDVCVKGCAMVWADLGADFHTQDLSSAVMDDRPLLFQHVAKTGRNASTGVPGAAHAHAVMEFTPDGRRIRKVMEWSGIVSEAMRGLVMRHGCVQ